METIIELERLLAEKSTLEDEFIKQSRIQLASYNSFMNKLYRCKQPSTRLTMYSEDIPKHKYIANTNTY